MSKPVTELEPNEFAITLGEKAIPKGVAKLDIQRIEKADKTVVYQLNYSVQIQAVQENQSPKGTKVKLQEGSFGVLKIGPNQNLKNVEFWITCINDGTGTDFQILTTLKADPPGSKGNHSN